MTYVYDASAMEEALGARGPSANHGYRRLVAHASTPNRDDGMTETTAVRQRVRGCGNSLSDGRHLGRCLKGLKGKGHTRRMHCCSEGQRINNCKCRSPMGDAAEAAWPQ